MTTRRLFAALFLSAAVAATAAAQTATPSDEYGRVSGGEIDAITRQSHDLSGSFGLTASRSQYPFAGSGRGVAATLGGTLVQDRVWFFASAQRTEPLFSSSTFGLAPSAGRALDTRLTANIGDRQNLAATFASSREPFAGVRPSSFLDLHYTGVVSDHAFFTATFSKHNVTQSVFPFVGQTP